MSYILITNSDGVSLSLVHADNEGAYLAHHGVKGQRWGVRRFQNPDGSLTELGANRRHNHTTIYDIDQYSKASMAQSKQTNTKLQKRE